MTDAVELVDEDGGAIGQAPRSTVHGPDTPLHRAFSLHLFDVAGQVLLTRRALSKRTWPGVWTNSCCGHPRPGESAEDAVVRRLREELGVSVAALRCVLPSFRYRATDVSGVVEHEVCPVFVGQVEGELLADSDEVAEWTWLPWSDLATAVTAAPAVFSPWLVLAVPAMVRSGFDGLRPAAGGLDG